MYQIIVNTADRKWLWEETSTDKNQLVSKVKNKFKNWKELWIQISDKNNLLIHWIKRPNKCNFKLER